jgi:hypothetical protein
MDVTRQQNRPRDLILDSQIHSYERRQTPLHDGVHVPSVQGTCYQSGSHRVEGLYGGAHLTSLLRNTDLHLTMSSSYLNGEDWTKQFISKILQITHSQSIFWNISLHDKTQGYLHNKKADEIMQQISVLLDLALEEVPEDRTADSCSRLISLSYHHIILKLKSIGRWWWTLLSRPKHWNLLEGHEPNGFDGNSIQRFLAERS